MPSEDAQVANQTGGQFPAPRLPIKFDRWLWERDVDNVAAARILGVTPVTIGRWRKRFDDPTRRPPPSETIAEIERMTGGEVGLQDWFRPAPVAYVDPDTTAPPADADGAAQTPAAPL